MQERVAQTISQGEHVKSAIDGARGQIEARYAEVEGRASALRATVQEHRQRVASALQTFFDAAHELGDRSVEAREQITAFLHDAQQDLQALHEHTEGEIQPALDEVLHHVKSVHESFGDRIAAMQEELGTVVGETHDFLTVETPQHLAELKAQVVEGHEEVRALIREQLMPSIQQPVDEYLTQLDALGAHLQERVASSRSTLQESTSATMQEMLEQFAQHSDVAQQFAQQVDGVMETLKESIDAGGTAVATGEEVVQTGVDTANAGLKAVIGTLEELKEFFSRFSFVSM
jgi:paraquat-inducible protein B